MTTDDSTTDQFAARLLETATKAERLLPPLEIVCALLSAALSYTLRHAPESETAEILRTTADKIQRAQAPRGPVN